MAKRRDRVYHRYPMKMKHGASETPCIVSFDGGETFAEFKNTPSKVSKDHKLEKVNGQWQLTEKKLR